MIGKEVIDQLALIVGKENILTQRVDRAVYSCDAEMLDTAMPDIVVLPESIEAVQKVVKLANRYRLPFTARGAGTGLSGGATTICGGIALVLTRLTKIKNINADERIATVEVGVTNSAVSQAASAYKLYFPPDPSSQAASTIGGNIAENAGGAHTFKYGTTTDYVLGMKIVLPDGNIIECKDKAPTLGLDWLSLFSGSEGTLGIVCEADLKLLPLPERRETLMVYFATLQEGADAVCQIISEGIIPCAMEMVDKLSLNAVEDAYKLGLRRHAEALLIIEIDGKEIAVQREKKQLEAIFSSINNLGFAWAKSNAERDAMWKARKAAFGALGRIAPYGYVLDGVVPRTTLAECISGINEIGKKYSLTIANIFHAGDGNLHPCILYDQNNEEQAEVVLKAAYEILKLGVDLGGSLTGEHGIGIEKRSAMPFAFSASDLKCMEAIKKAFDPDLLCNPAKILPNPSMCGESGIRPLLRHKLALGC